MYERNVVPCGFACRAVRIIALVAWMAGVAAAAPPAVEKESAAKPAPRQSPPHDTGVAAQWLSMLASPAALNLEGLIKPEKAALLSDNLWKIAGNVAKFLADNRNNEAILKPFSENSTELLSGNEAKVDIDNDQEASLLSNNPESKIEIEPFSENDVDLLSHNRPEILSGNRAKLFSDVRILSGIKVSVTINIQGSGEQPRVAGRDGIDSTFQQLDRDGDGKISAEEFRSAMRGK